MDYMRDRSSREPPLSSPRKPAKSPPMAFQMTSNDALIAPRDYTQPSQMPFHSPDYLNAASASINHEFEITSPMELDLQGQVRKQAEALKLQHQAFVVERECWEMEKGRLYRRIAALETLLRSPKGPSPSKSPDVVPSGAAVPMAPPMGHRLSSGSNNSRLPSIAEDDGSPVAKSERTVSFIKREGAPTTIVIPSDADIEKSNLDAQTPLSPPATRQVLSPPPAEYLKNAGHTPLRIDSRPSSSHSHKGPVGVDDTPTRRNTAHNFALSNDSDEDVGLAGPLRLPELPNVPSSENFTIDMLTARLQYIEEHPKESEPLALSAKINRDDESDVDVSEITIKAPDDGVTEPRDTPSLSQSDASVADMSPPPASEASQAYTPFEPPADHGGIKLKKKASLNFGAPLGQLRP